MPLVARAAKSYIAGPELDDALGVARGLRARGFAATLGFWDGPNDSPQSVAETYLAALDALAREDGDGYLSIKLPAIANSRELLKLVLDRAAARIHFDSLDPESADAMWAAAGDAAAGAAISCSLPGRWRRSLADADAAVAAGIIPRVVKGQWPDPGAPRLDLRQGFMEVVERLAGKAPHVAVATHDVPLAREAVQCLRVAGTTAELELLFGLPERAALALAEREGIRVRFYVPYGKAYLPYCLSQMRHQPRLLFWLMRDGLLRAHAVKA